MFRLTKISIANRIVVLLACIAILAFGIYVVSQIHQELFPPLNTPTISVVSVYPGASPAQVEKDVTTPLEQSFQGDQGVQRTISTSREGVSVITVLYDYGTDLDKAQQTLQQQVNKTQPNLPSQVTPQVAQYDVATAPIIYLSISSSQAQQDLALALKQSIVPALEGISGVANVDVTGVRDQVVSITLDLNKLTAKNLSIFSVLQGLQANNMTVPTGNTTWNQKTYSIRVGNALSSIEDVKNVTVALQQLPSGDYIPVKLSDVATVKEDLAPSTSLTRTNGQPGLGLSITQATNGNAVSISQALRNQIPNLEKLLGHGAKITITSDQAPYIQLSVGDLTREGLLGTGFAILVILIFLLSVRSTVITVLSIPLSVVIALIGLWTQNFSLNILTLSGLTIAIGRVVDDSIVVLENIYRHLRGGDEKLTAVLSGTREVATAVTASTLTTVAVFLPLVFVGGLIGEYTHPLALTVTMALLASLFVSLTIIPVLAYWFLKTPTSITNKVEMQEKPNILEKAYVPMIRWSTQHRAVTIALSILLLIGSFALFPLLPVNALGNQAGSSFSFSLTLPVNTSLDRTSDAAHNVETVLAKIPGIQTYQVTVGSDTSNFSSNNGSNVANFTISADLNVSATSVQQNVQDRLKGLTGIGILNFSNQGSSNTVDVTVQATNTQTLSQATQQVYDALAHMPHTSNITSDLTAGLNFINVQVDAKKATQHGLSADFVGEQIKMIYASTTVTQVTLNDVKHNVVFKIDASAISIPQMQNLIIQGQTAQGTAENLRLGDIATISLASDPTQISHLNGLRTATITLTASGQNVGAVNTDVQNRLKKLRLPSQATASMGVASTQQSKTLTNLYALLLAAILMVFMVMVVTFRNLIQPLLLLIAIPFALLGSIVLSAITQTPIGISSLYGALMLIGIVVTNAIVLIELVNRYRAKGLDARSAVIEGGRRRVRPILMTAAATIMALMPLALGLGTSNSSSYSIISGGLAIVVIGGLTTSTFLTLLLVPVFYTIIEDIRDRFRKQPITSSESEQTTTSVSEHIVTTL